MSVRSILLVWTENAFCGDVSNGFVENELFVWDFVAQRVRWGDACDIQGITRYKYGEFTDHYRAALRFNMARIMNIEQALKSQLIATEDQPKVAIEAPPPYA